MVDEIQLVPVTELLSYEPLEKREGERLVLTIGTLRYWVSEWDELRSVHVHPVTVERITLGVWKIVKMYGTWEQWARAWANRNLPRLLRRPHDRPEQPHPPCHNAMPDDELPF